MGKSIITLEAIDVNYGILGKSTLAGIDFEKQKVYQEYNLEFYNVDEMSPVQFRITVLEDVDVFLDQITLIPTHEIFLDQTKD